MAIFNTNDCVGRFRVQSIIKSNLYTETYRVEDDNNVPYFLKLFILKRLPNKYIDSDTHAVKEIEYCKQIKHRNIISFVAEGVYDCVEGECHYYVTNYFGGPLLIEKIREEGKLAENISLKIFRSILDGLHYLHHFSTVLCHNDIDPSNIMLTESTGGVPEIIDLGHVSERCSGNIPFETLDLDLLYHSNETMVGIFDEQGDIFSACAVLYTMLTGHAPWAINVPTDGSYKDRFKVVSEFRKSTPLNLEFEVSEKTKKILAKGLAIKSINRFSSIEEIYSFLDNPNSVEEENNNNSTSHPQTCNHEQNHGPNHVEFQIKKGNGKGFEDIAGMSELKELLNKQVVFVIKNKEVADEYKITPPNGMLLYGPPGCGKTFFAEKFAEETGFSYLLVKSSDLASSYVHGSQEKIRQLFDQAEKSSPIVVCFDEFDALVPDRSWNNVSSEEVNEFLSQMNNCSKRGIFIVATSNRPDKIDPAVLRTGRIDKMVYVPLPDFEARKEMFAIHLKGRPQEDSIDLDELARKTEGYIASDIAYIVNDSAMVAAFTRTKITGNHLYTSIQNTHPSVRTDVMKTYEDIRKKMEDNNRRNLGERGKIVAW